MILATLILGIGNLIMTDDGIGVRVVQRLAEEYSFPPEVEIIDGGTLGLDLLPLLEGLDRFLIIDAMETGGPPGTIRRLAGEEIPVAFESRLSPHQVGLKDLLAVSRLMGNPLPDMVLIGVQHECIELGMELSPPVEARLDELIDRVLQELDRWGICVERTSPAQRSIHQQAFQQLPRKDSMTTSRIITSKLLDHVTAEAKAIARKRKNYNFHTHDEAPCNRLLNAMEPGSYIRPHKHLDPAKDETMILVRGRLGIIFFDDLGTVTCTALLSPDTGSIGVDIPHGQFHTVISLDSGTVFFEAKAGPYLPLTEEEKAPWAPPEESDEAGGYLDTIASMF
ncbi:MAG: WbuC family cupin fold metalloprotein [Geobacteraceae bacterium]|nr:WbuC family cupin fold metalloprotein [Geobacteraceae bacterium]